MADAYLVDTGVFLRWFVEQAGFEHAWEIQQDFLNGVITLETVDFARIEVAEVLRKRGLLTGRLDKANFLAAVQVIDDLDVLVHQSDVGRLHRSAALSCRLSLRMFDALFVQTALDRGIPLLTTDARLCHAAQTLVTTKLLRGVSTS